ncbi:tyrosine-type recombinase/integrase [Lignipirellula cremea]|uniref:Phage integrase family protein n=1 Tax=Lignipirellula cremea TaxID=2528010 RepID=A0A518DRK8_9BACT|nr:site-specific integrase [Lignipirellula cremea]QDU94466.1 Phage integrase family protein [Lignipirellula cremea]
MGRQRKQRRQSHGSAWHWKQTDCWYYTMPGSKKRVALFDEKGERIRGRENKEAAEVALAKERVAWSDDAAPGPGSGQWLVARVCSDYIQYCEQGLAKGEISKSHRENTVRWLNDLCSYCGALPVVQLKKGHVTKWIEDHTTWKSSETRRGVIAVVLAAFNRAEELFSVANPLKGLKKPKPKPRLNSISPEDEEEIYGATEDRFKEFLFAAIHTGLRPFCELARITADDIEESPRGMMWRVYSSKTKKTRKIPVRPDVAELTRKLMKSAPKGSGSPIFRNTQGNPWKPTTGVVRFIAIRDKLGWSDDPVRSKYSCYTCRHTFAHRMLSGYWTEGAGCSIETLAELIGDTPKVAFDHYGKEWGQHYQEPLWNAIGEGASPNSQSHRPPASRKTAGAEKENTEKRGSASSSKHRAPANGSSTTKKSKSGS